MRTALLTVFLFLLTASVSFAQLVVIRHVNVIPMNRNIVLKARDVIIRDGRIEKITPAGKTALPGALIIDGSGRFLIPGLTDMHTHFFYEQGENINTCEAELKMMLANGLTTARILCGDSVYLDAHQKVASALWTGPRLVVASPQFVGRWPWPGKVFAAVCATPEQASLAVRKYKQEGYDEIKITFMVKADVYESIIATAKEEHIPVTGHVGPMVKLPAALRARQQIEHMDEFIEMLLPDTSYNHGMSVSDMGVWRKPNWETVDHLDENRIPMLVKQVKEADIFVTPTNYFFISCFGNGMQEDEIKRRPDYSFIPERLKEERWKIREHYWKDAPSEERRKKYISLRLKMTYALWKAGVGLMAGSDSPEWFLAQGFSIHDELEMMVSAGLSPFAALETATKNPASYLGTLDNSGTIAPGKNADLILLNENPLDNIRNTRTIETVIRGKNVYTGDDLKRLLAEARQTLR